MNFLDQVFFDNTVRMYLTVALVILLAILLKRFLSKHASGLLFRLGQKKWKGVSKEQFDDFLVNPLERLLVAAIAIFSISRLAYPKSLHFSIMHVTIREILFALAVAFLIISILLLILRFLDFVTLVVRIKSNLATSPGEHQLLFFFKDFIKVVLTIIGFVLVLKFSLRLDIGNLLTGLSIVGAALALAARESLENLIASFVIFFDKPFATGNYVKVKNVEGTVERIGLRSTRLRTNDQSVITVPNKQMVDNVLDNWSRRNESRNEIKTFFPASTQADELQKILREMKNLFGEHKKVKSYSVHLEEINNDTANILSVYFTDLHIPLKESNELRQQLNLEIKKLRENVTSVAE